MLNLGWVVTVLGAYFEVLDPWVPRPIFPISLLALVFRVAQIDWIVGKINGKWRTDNGTEEQTAHDVRRSQRMISSTLQSTDFLQTIYRVDQQLTLATFWTRRFL